MIVLVVELLDKANFPTYWFSLYILVLLYVLFGFLVDCITLPIVCTVDVLSILIMYCTGLTIIRL